MTAGDKHAHHKGEIRLERTDGVELYEGIGGQNGATAFWEDGTTSYVLHTRTGHEHGWKIADEADTVIQFVDALRAGEDFTPEQVAHTLQDIRRLRNRLDAIENEAILAGREYSAHTEREKIPGGSRQKPRLTVTEIAAELGLDQSTVTERYQRMSGGRHASWRGWLVQGTDRDGTYNAPKVRL